MIFQKNKDLFRENYKQKMERGSKEKFFLNRMCSLSSLFFDKKPKFSFEISFFFEQKRVFFLRTKSGSVKGEGFCNRWIFLFFVCMFSQWFLFSCLLIFFKCFFECFHFFAMFFCARR